MRHQRAGERAWEIGHEQDARSDSRRRPFPREAETRAVVGGQGVAVLDAHRQSATPGGRCQRNGSTAPPPASVTSERPISSPSPCSETGTVTVRGPKFVIDGVEPDGAIAAGTRSRGNIDYGHIGRAPRRCSAPPAMTSSPARSTPATTAGSAVTAPSLMTTTSRSRFGRKRSPANARAASRSARPPGWAIDSQSLAEGDQRSVVGRGERHAGACPSGSQSRRRPAAAAPGDAAPRDAPLPSARAMRRPGVALMLVEPSSRRMR